jgi:predicted ATPase
MSGPLRAWVALRPASVESRFEAMHASALTELVGREEELELLLRRWSKAKTGEGQVVLLSGEPGIGKSRLTAAMLERLANEPHTRLRYFCSPQHTDSALYSIISQMERAAGFAHDDTTQAKLDKLDRLLAQSFTPRQDAALLAEMLSLPNDGRHPTLELAPQQRRQKTLEALTAQMEALSQSDPVLMIFEDAHWIDPTSLEALNRAIERIRTLGVLLIITYRPDFEPPWIGQPHVTALTINRLGEREIAAMIDRVVGNKLLPASIRQDIIERTDGIPLFVEEMTKAVLEAEGAHDTAASVPSSVVVPASLHASLMARLDRLGPAKEVALIGAAIGREFSHALLAAVVRKPEEKLASALDRIVQAGLLFRQGASPHATYLFKHALVQDAAYGTVLREPRRALHARIADTLESQFAEIAENQPELLARHCTEAGLIEKAVVLWGRAGLRSLERSALAEAVAQLSRALDQSATLPASTALRREQIKHQTALTNALMLTKGYSASVTKASLDQARSLIEQADGLGEPLEDPLLLFSSLFAVWVNSAVAFEARTTLGHANHLLALAEESGNTAPLVIAHRALGQTLAYSGELVAARAHFDKGVALYDPAEHRQLATRFVQDPIETILSARAWALIALGFPDAAVADARQALKDAREINHAPTLIHALFFSSFIHVCCKDYVTASALIEELAVLTEKKNALFWKAGAMLNQGYLFTATGKAADAVRMTTSGLKAWRSTGATLWVPFFLSSLARAHADLKKFDDAWHCCTEAMTVLETTEERWCEAEVQRITGEIALLSPQPDIAKAEAYFERALAVARQQQAKSWELRAAMSLARLWRDQGKVQQARELLAPVYGWFTEGFDTRDLKEAKALLEEFTA